MKSPAAKLQWRQFCAAYADHPSLKDYNFGTLLRTDARLDYAEDNVTIVVKILWLAIEIARNREGKNDHITASA